MAPKNLVGNCWFVRIDGVKSFLRQKCVELSSCLDVKKMLSAYHEGDTRENPHCHFVIELTGPVQKQSADVRFKKLFEVDKVIRGKNPNYSSKPWDGDYTKGATSYLFHDSAFEILANVGFTEQELHACKQANEAVQAVVAVNNERASNKMVDKAINQYSGQSPTRFEILKFFVELIRKGEHYHPGSFVLKKYVEEVQIKLCESDEDVDILVNLLENSLWR